MKIGICGLAASGKSSVARALTIAHGFVYVNLGLIFRAVGFLLHHEKLSLSTVLPSVLSHRIAYLWNGKKEVIYVDGIEKTKEIQHPQLAEIIASRLFAEASGDHLMSFANNLLCAYPQVVFEGRNAGSVIGADANLKFFLSAEVSVRAQRRWRELSSLSKVSPDIAEVISLINFRDRLDTTRCSAPFVIPPDAILIDSTNRTIEECVVLMSSHILAVQ